MAAETTPEIPILDRHGEPTVRDVDLGARLGMKQPLGIRRTILENIEELQGYGMIHAVRVPATAADDGSGETTEYHLNEPQSLCLCLLSGMPQAADICRLLIDAFIAWYHDRGEQPPAGMQAATAGSVTFLHDDSDNTRFGWQGHSISTDLSRLDVSRDVVAMLPDGSIDSVRLTGPPYGIDGRQGITKLCLDPNSEELTSVMVIILGQIAGDTDRRAH